MEGDPQVNLEFGEIFGVEPGETERKEEEDPGFRLEWGCPGGGKDWE